MILEIESPHLSERYDRQRYRIRPGNLVITQMDGDEMTIERDGIRFDFRGFTLRSKLISKNTTSDYSIDYLWVVITDFDQASSWLTADLYETLFQNSVPQLIGRFSATRLDA